MGRDGHDQHPPVLGLLSLSNSALSNILRNPIIASVTQRLKKGRISHITSALLSVSMSRTEDILNVVLAGPYIEPQYGKTPRLMSLSSKLFLPLEIVTAMGDRP